MLAKREKIQQNSARPQISLGFRLQKQCFGGQMVRGLRLLEGELFVSLLAEGFGVGKDKDFQGKVVGRRRFEQNTGGFQVSTGKVKENRVNSRKINGKPVNYVEFMAIIQSQKQLSRDNRKFVLGKRLFRFQNPIKQLSSFAKLENNVQKHSVNEHIEALDDIRVFL